MGPDYKAKNEFLGKGEEADAIPEGPHEFVDERWPAGQVKVVPMVGSTAGPWFIEERYWPRFQKEEVPTRKKTRTEEQQLDTRETGDGKGKCWTECRVIERTYETPYVMVTQYVERWRINTTLKTYYDFVTGEAMTYGSTGVTIATTSAGGEMLGQAVAKQVFQNAVSFAKVAGEKVATKATMAAVGEAYGLAATGLNVVGLGVTVFVATSYVMRHWVQDAVRVSASWELVPSMSGYGQEALVKQTTAYWKRCGEIRDCVEPQKKNATGGAIGLPSGTGTKKLPMIWLGAGFFLLLLVIAAFGLTRPRNDAAAPTQAPAGNAAPRITLFRATFERPITTYTVQATDPDGDAITYTWTASIQCGTFASSGATATWSHPDRSIGGNCPDEPVHPGAITVVAADKAGASTSYTWTRGSDVGEARPTSP